MVVAREDVLQRDLFLRQKWARLRLSRLVLEAREAQEELARLETAQKARRAAFPALGRSILLEAEAEIKGPPALKHLEPQDTQAHGHLLLWRQRQHRERETLVALLVAAQDLTDEEAFMAVREAAAVDRVYQQTMQEAPEALNPMIQVLFSIQQLFTPQELTRPVPLAELLAEAPEPTAQTL